MNHLTDSTTPRTAREAFGSDFYPARGVRWGRGILLALAIVAIAFVAAGLFGCGGGHATPEEVALADARAVIGPPDCVNFPELCQ